MNKQDFERMIFPFVHFQRNNKTYVTFNINKWILGISNKSGQIDDVLDCHKKFYHIRRLIRTPTYILRGYFNVSQRTMDPNISFNFGQRVWFLISAMYFEHNRKLTDSFRLLVTVSSIDCSQITNMLYQWYKM